MWSACLKINVLLLGLLVPEDGTKTGRPRGYGHPVACHPTRGMIASSVLENNPDPNGERERGLTNPVLEAMQFRLQATRGGHREDT